jgi:cytochrome c-type biogenesis protein
MAASGAYAIGALAGALSTLSPCVLPLVPIVIGSAAAEHRWGPFALAGGVCLSFVAIGLFVASFGYGIGLDSDRFRAIGAVLLLVFGLILLSGALQQRFAAAGAALGNYAHGALARLTPAGLSGQFVVGLLLGAVWSPCAGPTLGAAATLAAQRSDLGQVALVMVLFGIGAAAPLVIIGALSREALLRRRRSIGVAGHAGKIVLGILMLAIGILILSGLDRSIEAALVAVTPDWLLDLTTRY